MSWNKLVTSPLSTSGYPTEWSALNTVKYDAATETLYMMTGAQTWAAFPISSKQIVAAIESGEIRLSASGEYEQFSLYETDGDGDIYITGEALVEEEDNGE